VTKTGISSSLGAAVHNMGIAHRRCVCRCCHAAFATVAATFTVAKPSATVPHASTIAVAVGAAIVAA
jgi:hypothetical protein